VNTEEGTVNTPGQIWTWFLNQTTDVRNTSRILIKCVFIYVQS